MWIPCKLGEILVGPTYIELNLEFKNFGGPCSWSSNFLIWMIRTVKYRWHPLPCNTLNFLFEWESGWGQQVVSMVWSPTHSRPVFKKDQNLHLVWVNPNQPALTHTCGSTFLTLSYLTRKLNPSPTQFKNSMRSIT